MRGIAANAAKPSMSGRSSSKTICTSILHQKYCDKSGSFQRLKYLDLRTGRFDQPEL
jgi:hypothetical protein